MDTPSFGRVIELPIRDGNYHERADLASLDLVIELPIRDGNE